MKSERVATEQLMNELFAFATKMLMRYGEFHPFGGYMLNDGSVVHVGLESEAQGPGSSGIRAVQLELRLRELAMAVRPLVVGIVKDVSLSIPVEDVRDAVEFNLEHRGGYCAEIFFPYRIVNGGQDVAFLDASAQAGTRGRFFDSRETKS